MKSRDRERPRPPCYSPALTREGPGMAAEGNKDKAEAALGIIGPPLYPAHAGGKALLSRLGPVLEVADEGAFDAATALAGYHLWCYGLMEEVTRAAVDQGLPRAAAAGMVAGLTRAAGE